MNIIYLVVSVILGIVTWVTTQLGWGYSYILTYIFLFFTSWYINLFFLHQDEFDRSKKFKIFTPVHLLYVILITVVIVWLSKYHLKDYKTVRFAFYKLVAIVNAVQAVLLTLYYKLRDVYHHL